LNDGTALPATLRAVAVGDIDDVNRVMAAAIDTWDLSPRLKRLAMPAYRYRRDDFDHLTVLGAWQADRLLGFVSVEPTDERQPLGGRPALLVHGLYVRPQVQGCGIGTRLIDAARELARERGLAGLLVRAERSARPFFEKAGFTPLPVEDAQRDYPHRLWASVDLP
jgi:GNAT superfamily N-acetyltransferase